MRYEVEIASRLHEVNVVRTGRGLAVEIDGRTWSVDAARIDAHRMSLLVAETAPESRAGAAVMSWEVTISSQPPSSQLIVHVGTTPFAVTVNDRGRRQDTAGRDRRASGAAGQPGRASRHAPGQSPGPDAGHSPGQDRPERILAPMPGKIVRVLVKVGDVVRVRQPLVVVEAMKMENELRAGRDGHIAAIHGQEGASVEAGALMVVIE
jgi:biotin carboxyl carrier protein